MEFAVYYSTLVRNYALKRKEGLLDNEFPKRIFEAEDFEKAISQAYELPIPDNITSISVLVVNSLEEPFYTVIHSELRDFQNVVGGDIEYTAVPDLKDIDIICSQNGKMEKCPLNRALYAENIMFDIIAGPIILISSDRDGKPKGLTHEKISECFSYFEKPEIFFFDNDKKDITTIKCSVELAKLMKSNKVSIIA